MCTFIFRRPGPGSCSDFCGAAIWICAWFGNPLTPPGFKAVPSRTALFSSRGESAPLSLKDLWGKPLLVPRCYRELLHSACLRQGFEPRTICESESPHTALLWAAGGLGIAVLPYTAAVLSTDARLLIRRLDTGLPSPRVCLVQQPDAALTDEVRAFIRLIQA